MDKNNSPPAQPKISFIEKMKQDRKNKMWEMRVAFVKQGNRSMQVKSFANAATNYEKYIRILEVYFECPQGELSPVHFKESAKTSEISVLAGVYWDLLRIYDSSAKYGDRQTKVAQQLAKFATLTPLFDQLVMQAQSFMKTAKNPDKVKIFLAGVGKASRCFIATSAYNSPLAPEVIALRQLRDFTLKKSRWGRKFIYYYYRISPSLACVLDQHSYLKRPLRWALSFLIKCVNKTDSSEL